MERTGKAMGFVIELTHKQGGPPPIQLRRSGDAGRTRIRDNAGGNTRRGPASSVPQGLIAENADPRTDNEALRTSGAKKLPVLAVQAALSHTRR
jgi:hypothetical protein